MLKRSAGHLNIKTKLQSLSKIIVVRKITQQKFIEDQLNFKFIRYNPDAENVS